MPETVLVPMKEHLEETIQKAIAAHADEILAKAKLQDGARENELRNGLSWALQSIMEKIEAGMTVEIRVIPPAKGATVAEADVFRDVAAIAKQLEFPKLTGEPVMVLTDDRANAAE